MNKIKFEQIYLPQRLRLHGERGENEQDHMYVISVLATTLGLERGIWKYGRFIIAELWAKYKLQARTAPSARACA